METTILLLFPVRLNISYRFKIHNRSQDSFLTKTTVTITLLYTRTHVKTSTILFFCMWIPRLRCAVGVPQSKKSVFMTKEPPPLHTLNPCLHSRGQRSTQQLAAVTLLWPAATVERILLPCLSLRPRRCSEIRLIHRLLACAPSEPSDMELHQHKHSFSFIRGWGGETRIRLTDHWSTETW